MLYNFRSALFIVGGLVLIVVTIFYGVRAHFERQVYVAVAKDMLGNDRAGVPEAEPLDIFVSRPHRCKPDTRDPRYSAPAVALNAVNGTSARPIPLDAMGGLVPIVTWEDTKRLHSAEYHWQNAARSLVFVSRVGFTKWWSNAVICVRNSRAPWGILILLERSGGEWHVYASALSVPVI